MTINTTKEQAVGSDNQIKSLNDILVISESIPDNFYLSTTTDDLLDKSIIASSGLVYSLDAEGEKRAKADATLINKFAKKMTSFIAETFKAQTKEVELWRKTKKDKVSALLDNRQMLIDQFQQMREKKLAEIRVKLQYELAYAWHTLGVSVPFQSLSEESIEALVKLSSLTTKGALTKKAIDAINSLAASNLSEQTRINSRTMEIENRCLRAEINPPFTHEFLGNAIYADDSVFNSKLDQLISLELERRQEHEQRIIQQQEKAKQAEIEAALKAQQAEIEAVARSTAKEEVPVLQNKVEQVVSETAKKTEDDSVAKTTNDQLPVGYHAVEINVKFKIQVSDRVSNKAVHSHFLTQINEKLRAAIESMEVI